MKQKPTSAHSWPFEYDSTPLGPNESRVIVRDAPAPKNMHEMSSTEVRPELTPLPTRIKALPIDERGYPIPWFVDYLDGKPEFRAMNPHKWKQAVREKLCWVCGQHLGSYLAFILGPMCVITRTTAEPPAHLECAQWSAINCPFLARPHARRREDEIMHANCPVAGGHAIRRNPGCAAIWITRSYKTWSPKRGEILIEVGDPVRIEWYAEGRAATRFEVDESVRTGLPLLVEQAEKQAGGTEALMEQVRNAEHLWPPRKDSNVLPA